VVAKSPTAKLLIGRRAFPIRTGEVFEVSQTQGDWLWVGRGWLRTNEIMTVADAVSGYQWRLIVRMREHDLVGALADCNAAIKLAPRLATFFGHRAAIQQLQGDTAGAKADLQRGVELAPYQEAIIVLTLAQDLDLAGAERLAVDLYWRTLTAQGATSEEERIAHHALARIWAEGDDKQLRDGKHAVEAAKKACELGHWNSFDDLTVLASAHAECGDFVEAVRWQSKAIDLARKGTAGERIYLGTTAAEMTHQLEERLACYQAAKRFEPPRQASQPKHVGGPASRSRR
jgi:tetratricopeptide (TPR) repeat protein